MCYEQEIENFTKRIVYMNHFIFFQVSVSYQSGYDESIPNTHFFLILNSNYDFTV